MGTHFDDKGKFFTPVITKVPVAVIIQTIHHRIEGKIHIRPDERIIDELDRSEGFLAVTDAIILDSDGKAMISTKFIALNRTQVIWILPVEEIQTHS